MPVFNSPNLAHLHFVPTVQIVPTRFYLHNVASAVAGTLPSIEQSIARNPDFNLGSQTINRAMDQTVGTSQTSIANTPTNAVNAQYVLYVSRWISAPLNQTSVAANTWTLNFAGKSSDISKTTSPTLASTMPITCYVWRPSTGARIGYIKDGGSIDDFARYSAANTEKSEHGTFTGDAVTCQVGDVIVLELFIYYKVDECGTNNNQTIYFDGTVVTQGDNTTVTSHASYLETPEVLSLL
jgi:hypothetical protein